MASRGMSVVQKDATSLVVIEKTFKKRMTDLIENRNESFVNACYEIQMETGEHFLLLPNAKVGPPLQANNGFYHRDLLLTLEPTTARHKLAREVMAKIFEDMRVTILGSSSKNKVLQFHSIYAFCEIRSVSDDGLTVDDPFIWEDGSIRYSITFSALKLKSVVEHCALRSVKIDVSADSDLFADCYSTGIGLDFTFKVEEGAIKASKFTLMTSSPVFKAMFAGQWKDSKGEEIEIKEVNYEAMSNFIKLLHGIELVNVKIPVLFQIMVIADRYEAQQVIKVLSRCLEKGIKDDNVVEMLTAANEVVQIEVVKIIIKRIQGYVAKNFKPEEIADLPDYEKASEQVVQQLEEAVGLGVPIAEEPPKKKKKQKN